MSHTGDELALLSDGVNDYSSIAISPDGQILATASEKIIQFWNIDEQKLIEIFTGPSAEIKYLVYRKNGKKIISLSTDASIHVWDTATGEVLSTLVGFSDTTANVAISPDGNDNCLFSIIFSYRQHPSV